ncbi:MAG TPA: Asp-tRNA(Asn)/Glu-tRNA(Gln) amidotransferase subunit GatB [Candidatus Limnocylindrales bacterium]|nr:Asp-tRNA(Asn)/Glu-tRNA(Gln) amidotransferase subunit GatB [Candidatus Limnocylindrales bacterium]
MSAPPASAANAAANAALERYEAVIGIEVHCQLKTASKMFCSCSTAYDGARPNSHVCPVCLGLPGALPVINKRAVEHVLAAGAAIGATTPDATRWDRKNYFYPDLPKGYQISQYDLPLAAAGRLTFETSEGPFTVGITRAHLEEDTAKLVHHETESGERVSLVDFNRSGAPLMEIVTDPDIRTAEQARRYAEELQLLLRTIGASDADMERGQMRVEANVSLRPRGTEAFGTRVEVKNMNSFRSVERAITFEIERQAAALDAGAPLRMETRGWSDDRGETYHMRSKETSDDYRYFPEPDLPPLRVDGTWLAGIRSDLPELPAERRVRYQAALGLSAYDAAVLTADAEAGRLFEATLNAGPSLEPKPVANWVTGDYLRLRNAATDPISVDPGQLADLIGRVAAGSINRASAQKVLEAHVESGETVEAAVARLGLAQISDADALGKIVDEVLAANPGPVADYRAGKAQAIGFLLGQVMKATRGQANAAVAQAALRSRLDGGAGA